MFNQTPSLATATTDPSRFHLGVGGAPQPPAEANAPVEEVVANHTAIRPSRSLGATYMIQSALTGIPLLLSDLAATTGGFMAASFLVSLVQGSLLGPPVLLQLSTLLVLQTLLMFVHQLYPGAGNSQVIELRGSVRSTMLSMLCLATLNLTLGQLPRVELVTFVLAALFISIALPLGRMLLRQLLARTKWWGIRLLLIGERNDCVATDRQLHRRRACGFIPVGYTCGKSDADEYGAVDSRLLGRHFDAETIALRYRTPVAGLVSPDDPSGNDRLIFQFPSVVWIDFAKAARSRLDASNLPHVFTTRLNMPFLRLMPRICKRAIDLAICIPGLMVLAVPMAVIAVAIKCFSPGPVIYGSTRVGQHGKRFKMWKFRSMVVDADAVLEQRLRDDPEARAQWEKDAKLKTDPRIIPGIGHLIRRWSLDELPQLWNVVMGEMSLVGPRPVPPNEIVRYQNHYYEYTQMWPGITGLWQVSGRNDTTFETRVFLVRHYARNWSPWLDLWVLLQTPAVVVSKQGAY